MVFMNARKRNKTVTYVIVAAVSIGLLLSVSLYWSGSSGTGTGGAAPGSPEALAVQEFSDGMKLAQQGKADQANKKFASAIKGFEEVLKDNPKNLPVMGDLATAYFYSDNVDKAIEMGNKALEVEPKYSTVRRNMAIYLFYGKNDAAGAIKHLEQIEKGDVNYDSAQQLLSEIKNANALPPQGGTLPPQSGDSLPPKN